MFTEERIGEILKQLDELRYPARQTLYGWQMQWRTGESKPQPSDQDGLWQEIPAAGVWGGHCEYAVFRAQVTIPAEFAGKAVEFSLLTGKEGQWDATNPQFSVYVDGVLRQGFDVNHHEIRLTDYAQADENHWLFLSAYTGVENFHLIFDAQLRVVDDAITKLYYDLLIPWQTACLLEPSDSSYLELIQTLTETVNLLDLRKPGSDAYYTSTTRAEEHLRQRLYTQPRPAEALVCCVGHTHIDVAWLWTLSVTEDKAVRSFSTVLELMRCYPEYIFMSSQPQLYKYVKRNAPEVYAQIKERVAEGRWEPEGGMFVEPDCNLASGEALVRQLLYGKRFFRQEFGKDNRILWLPDVFGYSAALPQILKKSGISYFMTTKISWNECNQLPYDTFYWKGIDGTKILSHFIPTRDYVSSTRHVVTNNEHTGRFTTNYNGYIHPCQIKGAWQRYQQKLLNREVLCSYGYGDGGGGPTKQMLETQRRLAYGIPGCPATKQSTALSFFEKLEQDLQGKPVPIWSGELYLEYHRGTYTSMARNKRDNRRGEFALANAETQSVLANHLWGEVYPKAQLQELWEVLLRNQFHDILPGSSIWEVYEDSAAEYATLLGTTRILENRLLQTLADKVGGRIVWNPNGQTMDGFVTLDNADGLTQVQKTADGHYLAWAEAVPAKGYGLLPDCAPKCGTVQISPERVETPFAEICLNNRGQITSWYDKMAQRQLLQAGQCANVLMTYEDKPHKYDNWNLFDYYKEKSWPAEQLLSAQVTEQGPYRYAMELCWQYQDTEIAETLYFYGSTPRVDIRFTTDWKEDQLLLKALFPLDLNTTEATFDIQYGNVKRSTAVNTSWDAARFEVCCHKWMDVSEGGYGVSILNDSKYGVSVEENVVGLSLLKCGRYPNPLADREHHKAVYSVFPHQGDWKAAGTVREAYLLNNPMRVFDGRKGQRELPETYNPVTHEHRNIMIEAVKQAEDGPELIVRLYEFENCRTQASLKLGQPAKNIWLCNLMEEPERLLAQNIDTVTVAVEAFGIVTLRIEIA